MARQRLDLREAAEALGTTVDAVRKRVQRGSLDSEKGEDGRVYVWLDTDQTQAQDEGSELVVELRDRVRSLEKMLEEERQARTEERLRHDTLMAQLMQRIPELEAPQERSPDTLQGEAGGASREEAPPVQEAPEPRSGTGGSQEGAQPRSWWRRVFGGG